MKTVLNFASILAGIAILGLVAAGIYALAMSFIGLFSRLAPQVASLTAIASIVILLSALLIASGIRWAKRRELEHRERAEKRALYERFATTWSDMLQRGPDDRANFSSCARELRALNTALFLRGNVSVLKSHARLWKTAQETDYAGAELTPQTIEVLREMRQDLGLTLKGIDETYLLGPAPGLSEVWRGRAEKDRRIDEQVTMPA